MVPASDRGHSAVPACGCKSDPQRLVPGGSHIDSWRRLETGLLSTHVSGKLRSSSHHRVSFALQSFFRSCHGNPCENGCAWEVSKVYRRAGGLSCVILLVVFSGQFTAHDLFMYGGRLNMPWGSLPLGHLTTQEVEEAPGCCVHHCSTSPQSSFKLTEQHARRKLRLPTYFRSVQPLSADFAV